MQAYSDRSVAEASLVISASRGADASAPRDAGAGVSPSLVSPSWRVGSSPLTLEPREREIRGVWRRHLVLIRTPLDRAFRL